MQGGALMTEPDDNQPPDVFTRKWLLVMILCLVPPFFLFVLLGDPGRGRAAAICTCVCMTAIRACWDLRKHLWFWVTAAILIVLHVFLVLLIPWTGKSYPGYTLLPVGVLDYGIVYGSLKLVEKAMKKGAGAVP
jgi:hypothetical protein